MAALMAEAVTATREDAEAVVRAYHEGSKHHFHAYAPGPETLDWDAQPDPFRTYAGCERVPLPLSEPPGAVRYADAVMGRVAPQPFALPALAQLLKLAFGLTAWKQSGTARWALRANPSSGNLHPTEVWVLVRGWPGLAAGLYHYDCLEHTLEHRCSWRDGGDAPELAMGLSSVYWREAWKYGARAFRYCQLDIGHALGALRFAAAALGWRCAQEIVDGDALRQLLGLARAEQRRVESEAAECLLRIERRDAVAGTGAWPSVPDWWAGVPNRLDPRPLYQWPVIDRVAAAAGAGRAGFAATGAAAALPDAGAAQVVRHRRSAQAYDSGAVLERAQFAALLDALAEIVPAENAQLHLIVAVHRVRDVAPGLYVLPRSARGERRLRRLLTRWPLWAPTALSAAGRPLYLLKCANVQRALATLCCQQTIAGDSAVLFGFLADFESGMADAYRSLLWEAGALGQALYLRATALELAATGIGCFFDDPWRQLFGIDSDALQFLYHLAAGVPRRDARLVSLSGYFHVRERGEP